LSNHCPNPSRRDGMPTPDGFDCVTTARARARQLNSVLPPTFAHPSLVPVSTLATCPFPDGRLGPVCLLQGAAADAQ
jgi:hypothetical protein